MAFHLCILWNTVMPPHIIELEGYLKFNCMLSLQEYKFKFYILSVQDMFGNAL